jgi:hypothetical protein
VGERVRLGPKARLNPAGHHPSAPSLARPWSGSCESLPSAPVRRLATCRPTPLGVSGPPRSRSGVRRRCGSAGSSRTRRSARHVLCRATRTWRSSARGASPRASRRARRQRSSSSGLRLQATPSVCRPVAAGSAHGGSTPVLQGNYTPRRELRRRSQGPRPGQPHGTDRPDNRPQL